MPSAALDTRRFRVDFVFGPPSSKQHGGTGSDDKTTCFGAFVPICPTVGGLYFGDRRLATQQHKERVGAVVTRSQSRDLRGVEIRPFVCFLLSSSRPVFVP